MQILGIRYVELVHVISLGCRMGIGPVDEATSFSTWRFSYVDPKLILDIKFPFARSLVTRKWNSNNVTKSESKGAVPIQGLIGDPVPRGHVIVVGIGRTVTKVYEV